MIEGAESSILMTGYSLSSYFSELTDTIIGKSRKGGLSNFPSTTSRTNQKQANCFTQGLLSQAIRYNNKEDKMAALHAKIISADMK